MAGNTRGTYRSKSNKGRGIPEPPVIDFAWLKMWWPECTRREPVNSEKRKLRPYQVKFNSPDGRPGMFYLDALSSLEARCKTAKKFGLKKVPGKRGTRLAVPS